MSFAMTLLVFATQSAIPPSLVQTEIALDLVVDYDTRIISGTAALTVENVGIAPVTDVPLQLGRLMTVSEIRDSSGIALPFTQDVVQYVDWPQLQINQIHVEVASLKPGDRTTLVLSYSGTLVGYTESGMRYVQDHIDRRFTIIRTDAWAFPQVGVPSVQARRASPRRDFDFRAKLTVPSGLTVVTPVSERERRTTGEYTTWTFVGDAPVPFLNIAVAPYELVEQEGVRIFYFPDDSAGARKILTGVKQATELYASWFGPLGRELRLTVTEIPEGWGSQASLTGGILQTADAFRRGDRLSALYHELAHLWHPMDIDLPPSRWYEGLASFLGHRVTADLKGDDSVDSTMHVFASSVVDRVAARDGSVVPMADYGKRGLTDLSYSTGRLMFHVLFSVLGADRFDEIMGAYFRTFRSSGSTTEQFADFVTEQAPITSQVFTDWLYTVRWYEALHSGQSLSDVIVGYTQRDASPT